MLQLRYDGLGIQYVGFTKKELVQAMTLERLMITIVRNIELHLPAF